MGYASDVRDEEWTILEPYWNRSKRGDRANIRCGRSAMRSDMYKGQDVNGGCGRPIFHRGLRCI